jgi:hypothetical protein
LGDDASRCSTEQAVLTRLSTAGVLSLVMFLAGATGSAVATTGPPGKVLVCSNGICRWVVEKPAEGGGATPVGTRQCTWEVKRRVVPCYLPGGGSYGSDGCYYKLSDPQPPAGDPAWQGHKPGDGAVYDQTCYRTAGLTREMAVWRETPPPGVSPQTLAMRAVAMLRMRGPAIGIVPKPGSEGGLVGLPVWMWTAVTPTTWGPNSATAAVPGLSVTATAKAQKIVWRMGDGHAVTCPNPGTPYKPSYGDRKSPTCGYVYEAPNSYTVTGTTYWSVSWAGGGESGVIELQQSSSTQIDIGELQVLVR